MNVLTLNVADITAEGLSWSGILPSEDLRLTDADVPIRGTANLQVGSDGLLSGLIDHAAFPS